MSELIFHKLSELFPLLDGTDLDELVNDIKENGQIKSITLYEGQILDGRNRYLACQALGIVPNTQEYTGSDPFQFVVSKNLHRRHLTTSQRAMIAAEIATTRHGGDRVSEQARNSTLAPISQTKAAEALKVSVDSVKKAANIKKKSSPKIVQAVKDGKLTLHAAKKQGNQNPRKQPIGKSSPDTLNTDPNATDKRNLSLFIDKAGVTDLLFWSDNFREIANLYTSYIRSMPSFDYNGEDSRDAAKNARDTILRNTETIQEALGELKRELETS